MTLRQAKAALAAWSNDAPPPARQQLMILESLQRLKQQSRAKPRPTLADALKNAMRAWRPPKRKPGRRPVDLLSAAQLARALGLSVDQIARLKGKGVLVGYVFGKRTYFNPDLCRAAIAEHAKSVEDARARSKRRASEITCCVCKRVLPRALFIPTIERQRRGDKVYEYATVSSDCKGCRAERKRRLRKQRGGMSQAEYRGELAARKERNRLERERLASERAARRAAIPKLSPKERIQRIVDRQRERRHTDPEYYAARQALKIRRKRAMDGTQVEPIKREIVAERDGWRCGICGGKVTRETWSLDHVVPLSKGGSHTYANVVLAHRRCNVKRGVGKLAVQAPLFARP